MPSGIYTRRTFENPPRTRSGYKGVLHCPWLERKPWKAYGRHHGMYVTIGYFETKLAAAAAYNEWAIKTHGTTAFLNKI